MKIIILIYILFIYTFSYSINMKVVGFNVHQDVRVTANDIVNELSALLEQPLNWCTVKPTGEINVLRKGITHSNVFITVKVKCDHTEARKLFKDIWNRYDTFLNDHGDIVDNVMERRYPGYHLNWGYGLNGYDFIQLKLLPNFGGSTSFANKMLFFRLTINAEYETIPMRVGMSGNLIKIIATNGIPNRPPEEIRKFLISVPNKLLKSGDIDIKIDRVWHLVNNEEYIRSY